MITQEMVQLNKENFISSEEILSTVTGIYKNALHENFGDDIQTRSYLLEGKTFDKSVRDIFSFNDDKNISACYAVNFEGGGFIIVSADKRMPEVLAISETNSFDFAFNSRELKVDELKSEEMLSKMPYGLIIWIEDINNAVTAIRYNSLSDSSDNNTDKANDVTTDANEITLGYEINTPPPGTPYLVNTTWGQGNGYNDSLAFCSGSQNIS